MTLFAKKQGRWLIAILIAALVLPWCRVICATAPTISQSEHCATHATQFIAKKHSRNHLFLSGLECPDDQQSITANHYSIDSAAKHLPLWFAIGAAFVFIFATFDFPAPAFFRTRIPTAPPTRRHLLFCVFRD